MKVKVSPIGGSVTPILALCLLPMQAPHSAQQRCMGRVHSVLLPCNPPVFFRASRLYDELLARELKCARQISADQSPHQRAVDVIVEGMSTFVDLICTE